MDIFSLSFRGKLSRQQYAVRAFLVFVIQYAVAAFFLFALHQPLTLGPQFWAMPLQQLATVHALADAAFIAAQAGMLVAAWAQAAFAFRRCADANMSGWIAAAAVVPVFQILAIAILIYAPTQALLPEGNVDTAGRLPDGNLAQTVLNRIVSTAMQGVLLGIAMTLFGVAVSTLVFRVYGYGVFVVTPLLAGAVSGFMANRNGDIGSYPTNHVVLWTSVLGSLMLVVFALEGIVCIVMAAPLGMGAAVLGGVLGRGIALRRDRSMKPTLMSVAFLPMLFGAEAAMPSLTALDTEQSIEIAAPPEKVWRALLNMNFENSTPALPFRLGLAYPLKAEIVGEGVGALRRGVFSTGVAMEEITEWVPNRKLAFVVLSDPPALREMSPYKHVHAPHVRGYFQTLSTSFELVPLEGGRTRVVERTSHRLKLDPILYWMPLARVVVDQNNARVLAAIRDSAKSR